MFLFLKLCLAHAIADFVLQFEELYRLKLKSRLGHFFHAGIHAVLSLALAFPSLVSPWAFVYILAVSTVHYFQDTIKYHFQERHPGTSFWCFTIDQIVHFAIIATAFLTPQSWQHPAGTQSSANPADLYLLAFILGTFGGSYFLHNLRKTFFPGSRPDHLITNFEILHAMLERTLIGFIFIAAPPVYFAMTPLTGLTRMASPKLRDRTDFLLSYLYAAALGLLFRMWL